MRAALKQEPVSDLELEPRQRRAQAVMNAEAKRQVRVILAIQNQLIGALEPFWIAIPGGVQQAHLCAAAKVDIVKGVNAFPSSPRRRVCSGGSLSIR